MFEKSAPFLLSHGSKIRPIKPKTVSLSHLLAIQSLHFRPWKIFRQGAILRRGTICRLCPDEILLPRTVCFQSKYFVQTLYFDFFTFCPDAIWCWETIFHGRIWTDCRVDNPAMSLKMNEQHYCQHVIMNSCICRRTMIYSSLGVHHS